MVKVESVHATISSYKYKTSRKLQNQRLLPGEATWPCSYQLEPVTPVTPGCVSEVSKALIKDWQGWLMSLNRSLGEGGCWEMKAKHQMTEVRWLKGGASVIWVGGGGKGRRIRPNRRPQFAYVAYLCDKIKPIFHLVPRGSHLFGSHVHIQRMNQPSILLFQYWE